VAGNPQATLALAIYARRAAAGIAAVSTSLERLDAIVFTGGISEHSARVRSAVCERLAVLGVQPPSADPAERDTDVVLSEQGVPVAILRVVAREDLVIARQAAELLAAR
jgi:acetate kinase